MTTTLRPSTATPRNGHRITDSRPTAATPPSALERNRARISVGVIVISLCVAGVTTTITRAADRRAVVAVANHIPSGAVIESDDLTVVELPTDTRLSSIDADSLTDIVGQTATATIAAGSLLSPSHVSTDARLPIGTVMVGAVLDPGQYPVGLRPGDTVEIIDTSSADDGLASATSLGNGEVTEIAEPPTGGRALMISLLVPESTGRAVAASGAAGELSLIVVGAR